MLVDRALVWRGERKSAIVFVARSAPSDGKEATSYVLVPTAANAFRDFLLDLGFERGSVGVYLQKPAFELDQFSCLALAASPQICIDVRLERHTSIDAQGRRQDDLMFLADDARRQLVEARIGARALALVGAVNLSLGMTRGTVDSGMSGATTSQNLSYATRGVLSKGERLLQYDVTGSFSRSNAVDESPQYPVGQIVRPSRGLTRINLLASGQRLDLGGGTVYAGLFQSDIGMGGAAGGGTSMFFVNPMILGVAWASDGGDISSFGRTQRVRLHLLSPAYVRIVSQGAQLFEGQLQPGEQIVSFSGYGQPFVDVLVRDVSGVEQRQRGEVLPAAVDDTATFDQSRNPHGFYVDVGKPTLQNTVEGSTYRRFRVLDQNVLSFGYARAGAWGRLRAGIQGGTGFTRVATSLADLSLSSQGSLMLGTHGERGFSGSYQPMLENGWQPSASFTAYRASQASRPLDTGTGPSGIADVVAAPSDCRLPIQILRCYLPADHRSTTLGVGHRDWPLRLTYSETRSDAAVLKRAGLQASFNVRIAGRQASLLTMVGYESGTKAKSLLVVCVIPLDSPGTMSTSSGSTDLKGGSAVSAGYSQSLDPDAHDHLRSYSLNASGSRDPGGGLSGTRGEAAAVYLGSRLGSVANATSLNVSRNSTSMQSSFSTDYALTESGTAFTRENMGSVGSTRLFESLGSAGVTIANRSQEPQTALIDGASVDVPPGTNVYVPVTAGYLRGVTVSPGPALDEERAKAGQYLYKGNVKAVVIADGFWVMARFESPQGRALRVQFTSRQPGDRLERLYLDSRMQAMLFELREEGPTITRFVTTEGVDGRPGDEYRCTVPQADAPRPDQVATYRALRYACTPLPPSP